MTKMYFMGEEIGGNNLGSLDKTYVTSSSTGNDGVDSTDAYIYSINKDIIKIELVLSVAPNATITLNTTGTLVLDIPEGFKLNGYLISQNVERRSYGTFYDGCRGNIYGGAISWYQNKLVIKPLKTITILNDSNTYKPVVFIGG